MAPRYELAKNAKMLEKKNTIMSVPLSFCGRSRKEIHFSSLCTYFENEKLLVLAGTVDCAKDSDSYDDDDEIQDHSTQMCLTETDTTSTRSSCSDESHASIYGKLSSTLY